MPLGWHVLLVLPPRRVSHWTTPPPGPLNTNPIHPVPPHTRPSSARSLSDVPHLRPYYGRSDRPPPLAGGEVGRRPCGVGSSSLPVVAPAGSWVFSSNLAQTYSHRAISGRHEGSFWCFLHIPETAISSTEIQPMRNLRKHCRNFF